MNKSEGSSSAPRESTTDRFEEILNRSAELFYEHGYNGVGIRSIARSIGIQTSSLYYYFDSKEDILYQIALRATKDFIDAYLETLHNSGDVVDTLKLIVRSHVRFFWKNRFAQQVTGQEFRELSPGHMEEIRQRQREYTNELVDYVTQGVAEGKLRVKQPAIATRGFLDMLNSLFNWFQPRPSLQIDDVADLYAEFIVDGILGAEVAAIQEDDSAIKH